MGTFEVDKQGLKQLLKGKDKSFIIRELVQNVWDEPDVTECNIRFEWEDRKAILEVQDDAPEGFYDLRHAYTLFAPTRKQVNPEKRGRFNLGEKFVIALCREAEITTTKGCVFFDSKGNRRHKRTKTEKGSIIKGVLPISKAEFESIYLKTQSIIPPPGIKTTLNGKLIHQRVPLDKVSARLQTEHADKQGNMKTTIRKTIIEVHEVLEGEEAMLYEMGLPIVETGDKWHYDIQQRVPLTIDRKNVGRAFLRAVRVHVLNAMHKSIDEEDAAEEGFDVPGEPGLPAEEPDSPET